MVLCPWCNVGGECDNTVYSCSDLDVVYHHGVIGQEEVKDASSLYCIEFVGEGEAYS